MAASRSALITLLVFVSSVAAASATTFTVGDSSGWKLGVNYDNWASGKTFTDGDQLVFNFITGNHDVVEVDKSGYDGCSTTNAANTIQNGPATVNLTSGTHYYICGISGHCSGGMKLAVTVGSGSGSGSGSPTPGGGSPSTPTPTTPSAPAPDTPAGASVRLTAGPALAVAATMLVSLF